MSQIKDSSFESGKQQANKWSLALHSVQFPFSISSLPSSILIIQIIAARGKGNGWQANTHARMHAHTHAGDGLALRRTSPGRQRIFSLSEKSIGGGGGRVRKGGGGLERENYDAVNKGCDLFSNRPVSLGSRQAPNNPKCRFKLVSRAESRAVTTLTHSRPVQFGRLQARTGRWAVSCSDRI